MALKRGVSVAKKGKTRGKVDLAKLFSTMDSRSGGDRFKLNKAGTVRFRLVEPLGDDSIPMQPLDEHWLPYIKEDGKEGKRPVTCMELQDVVCPVCVLHSLLTASRIVDLEELGREIRISKRWLMYVVNRSYMMTQEEPTVIDTMEKIEQASLPQTVAQAMVNLMRNRAWGDPTHPTNGYDLEVTGSAKGGKSQFTEYAVSPVPRDSSPDYNPVLTKDFKPLSELIEFRTLEDLHSLLEPILATLATNGYGDLVDAFWEELADAESHSPEQEETEEEYEMEDGDVEGGDVSDSDEAEEEGEYSEEEEENEEEGDYEGDASEEEGTDDEEADEEEEEEIEPEDEEGEEEDEPEDEGEDEDFGKAVELPAQPKRAATKTPAKKAAAPKKATKRRTPAESTMDKSVSAKDKPSNLLSTLSNIRKGKK